MSDRDKELLELAAKAYGDPSIAADHIGFMRCIGHNEEIGCDVFCVWNPLIDDGDALRLAVKLEMDVQQDTDLVYVWYWSGASDADCINEDVGDDRLFATRTAIVRAAAEIGRNMP